MESLPRHSRWSTATDKQSAGNIPLEPEQSTEDIIGDISRSSPPILYSCVHRPQIGDDSTDPVASSGGRATTLDKSNQVIVVTERPRRAHDAWPKEMVLAHPCSKGYKR
jgi:hypothetical protein